MSNGNYEIPLVEFTNTERENAAPPNQKTNSAYEKFRHEGFVRMDNVFAPKLVEHFSAHYRKRYQHTLESTTRQDGRPLYTLDVEGPFNDPTVYANPLVLPFLERCLGPDCILGAMSIIVSFPGAPAQRIHRDSKSLFGQNFLFDKDLPPYSMTMLIPLVDCTVETGCTQVWPRTHLTTETDESAASVSPVDPEVLAGSVLFTDSRLIHRGGANLSSRHRPVVYLTYQRAWYRDFWGYDGRPPVNIDGSEFARVPDQYKHLFSWTKDPYRRYRIRNRLRHLLPSKIMNAVRRK
jgi:ectoine hydroxylase-related dioxygenase (phytanoyl-CoA dioxygenase family)